MRLQCGDISGIGQIDCTAKDRIFNALVMRTAYIVNRARAFDPAFQPGPTWESVLTSDGELRIAEAQRRFKDFIIYSFAKSRMEFANPLRHGAIARCMGFQQIFCLMLEMIQTGIGRENSSRHDELLSLARGP